MKEEALAIAKELSTHHYFSLKAVEDARKASNIIFRLVEELDNNKLRNSDNPFAKALRNAEALKIKPLSDEEILHIYSESYRNTLMGIDPLVFARAIEERHGIK